MCRRLSFICLVVSSLSIHLVLSAPSQKRVDSSEHDSQGKVQQLVQSPKTVDAFDENWWAVDNVHEENENKPVPTKAENTTPKPSAISKDFKTICEDKDASGKCRTVQSGEKQPDHLPHGLGLEQLISSHHQLTEEEAKHILQMINSMSNKLHELQRNKPCATNHGKIAEIEEKHITERKFIKKKEHDETKTDKNEKDSLNPNAVQNVPPKMNYPVTDSPPLEQATNANTKAPNPGPGDPNFLEGDPANVNYNGGMNRPMDTLIKQYPEGHWPEKGNEADVGNEVDSSEKSTEAGKDGEATPGQDEYYENEDDFKEQEATEAPSHNIHPLLNPKYLENIIKQEQQSSQVKYDNSKNHHHVQEHVLPKKRSFSILNSLRQRIV